MASDQDEWVAKLATVSVYAVARAKDKVVPAEWSERMITAIRKARGLEFASLFSTDESLLSPTLFPLQT